MRILYGHDAEVAEWVGQRISHMGSGLAFGPCVALGVLTSDGKLVGGVVYSHHVPAYRNIELSFAGEGAWLTRDIIRALLRYPFDQLNCQRVTGCTPQSATSAIRFLNKFGFRREGVVWRGFGRDHMVISGLRRTYWQRSKWALPRQERQKLCEAPHGETHSHATAGA